jgi:hypothetical protein
MSLLNLSCSNFRRRKKKGRNQRQTQRGTQRAALNLCQSNDKLEYR